ncbi:MAG: hypothetical protein QN120_12865 [Armatimonadota bacterium]|nr:hypothetical protein [Armatimonadota bacterium]
MRAWLGAFLSERARLLLLSLGIAVALWFYVGSTGRPPREGAPVAALRLYNVEVTFVGLDEGVKAVAAPAAVDIEMRWPATEVLAVRPTDVRAVADLTALQPGFHRVSLRIQVPAGVTSVQASPPEVLVTLSRP